MDTVAAVDRLPEFLAAGRPASQVHRLTLSVDDPLVQAIEAEANRAFQIPGR